MLIFISSELDEYLVVVRIVGFQNTGTLETFLVGVNVVYNCVIFGRRCLYKLLRFQISTYVCYCLLVFTLNVYVKIAHYDFVFIFSSGWNEFQVFNKLGS